MAQLWGGRFIKETAQEVFDFNESLSFDKRLLPQDIAGSIAHVKMLSKQSVISQQEAELIIKGLEMIESDAAHDQLDFDCGFEDVHSMVEALLIERVGDTGKKLHTGRSRNDQVALDMRLYTREHIDLTREQL